MRAKKVAVIGELGLVAFLNVISARLYSLDRESLIFLFFFPLSFLHDLSLILFFGLKSNLSSPREIIMIRSWPLRTGHCQDPLA